MLKLLTPIAEYGGNDMLLTKRETRVVYMSVIIFKLTSFRIFVRIWLLFLYIFVKYMGWVYCIFVKAMI